jgi:hypothetical protein
MNKDKKTLKKTEKENNNDNDNNNNNNNNNNDILHEDIDTYLSRF